MPKTRSQAAAADEDVDYPASPSVSNPPPASALRPRPTVVTSAMTPAPTTATERPPERAPSVRSQRSTNSTSARIRRAEIEAEERLAELQRKELQIQANLIKKKLAAEIDTIREESERGSLCDQGQDIAETSRRVSEWVDHTQTRGERVTDAELTVPTRTDTERVKETELCTVTPNVTFKATTRLVSPHRAASRERGIDKLADALEKMTRGSRYRKPPELPPFNGAPGEWLPFKAAVREATTVYGIPPTESLARLRACLKGEAQQCVAALLYTATEPSAIMATLEQKYGQPEIIIDQALEDLRKLPRIGSTAAELNNFAIKLQNIVTVISCIDKRGYLQNPMLARHITERMSEHLRSRWCDYAEEHGTQKEAEVITLSRFFMREAERAVRHCYSTSAPNAQVKTTYRDTTLRPVSLDRPPRPTKRANVYSTSEAPKKAVCYCCGGEHTTTQCKKLKEMPVEERWRWAKETRICFLCVNNKHRRFTCKAKRCGIDECSMPHHALLHAHTERGNATSAPKEDSAITASARIPADLGVLLKVCPIAIRGPAGEVETFGLLDEGSTISLIDHELATQIGAQGPTRPLNIHGATSSQREASSQAVDIEVRGRRQEGYYAIKARTVQHLALGSQSVKRELLEQRHLKILHAEDVCYSDVKPRVLIGADNWHLIVSRKLLTGKRTQPAASLTKIGWVIHGTTPRSTIIAQDERVLHIRTMQEQDSELHDLVKAHFELDSIGISNRPKPVAANQRAVDIFNRTARRVEGRFEVGLPWKTDNVQLPPSYDMSLRRLKGIERKMDKSPEFKESYTKEIEKLIEKGYATKCETDHSSEHKMWYLPHFAVTNPNKPGKVRLVFDSAARANGVCMNDVLLDGPDLLSNLNGILYRFRERPVAITADIREMFLRVKIRNDDRVIQHFLWRGEERARPPDTYVMTSMIFGARSSPFLAHSVRNKNAEEYRDTHPLAYVPITRSHYMDDWVQSFSDEETAATTMKEVTEVHKKAGFELAGWSSNRPQLLRGVDSSDQATTPKELGANGNEYEKTLGLKWIATADELAFNTDMPRIPQEVKSGARIPTKREALGAVMSIFDPTGQISPYVISAKTILQSLWRHAMAWDDPLPPEEAASFTEWIQDVKYIKKLRIPRCYSPLPAEERQLHVFSDASDQAYATAAYWRYLYGDGSVHLVLIAGKAKVAPMKPQSIPRMELQASLIGARLAAEVIREHEFEGRVVYWSDSKTALHWIRNDSTRYAPYVAHRLGEIAELTKVHEWRWVPTAHNVADDATRAGNTQLKNTDRWFTGPPFLREPEECWPREEAENIEEAEVLAVRTTEKAQIVDFTRFSSYERLLRTVVKVLKFCDKCRKHENETDIDRVKRSERILIQQAQFETFPEEIVRLKAGKMVDRTSRLLKLDPVYTEDGILRLRGRINAAPVPEEMKSPPILGGDHPLSRLLVKREHERNGHIGREHLVNNMRQQYWILRLRPRARRIIRECNWCNSRRKQPGIPVKGDLPKERLDAYTRPFSRCGLDGFGPMWVTIGRRREKRWGLLFTCLVTRAIHIELLNSLSTDSAIMAIRRMAARRGFPATFFSDNGTNFHGSEVEMNKAYDEWLPHLKEFTLAKKVEWRYIDPGAPNQGGAWERMIRSVKTALALTLTDKAPKEEVLATVLTEIENTVNSRPLTHVSVCEEYPEALTPNHLLLGTALGSPIVGECDIADRRAWRAAQGIANSFWVRWLKEYLPTLTPRGDVRRPSQNLKAGDCVIIVDGLLPRGLWPRGKIETVYAGPDGVVRSADVRTRGGVFRRPARRLVVLPTEPGCEDLRRGETVADNESRTYHVI